MAGNFIKNCLLRVTEKLTYSEIIDKTFLTMKKNYKRKYSGGKTRTYKKGKLKSYQKGYYRTEGNYGRYKKDGELKFIDGQDTDAIVSLAGTIIEAGSIINIAQGTTQNERIGRKIVIKKIAINIRVFLNLQSAMNLTADEFRIIIYQDKQCNGATAAVGDLLATGDIQSFRNLTETGRFKFLYDHKVQLNCKVITINAADTIATGVFAKSWAHYIDCSIPIEYDSTTGAITEIRSNNIGILVISHNSIAQSDLHWRIRYTDN